MKNIEHTAQNWEREQNTKSCDKKKTVIKCSVALAELLNREFSQAGKL